MFVLFSSIAATDPCDIVPVLADPADFPHTQETGFLLRVIEICFSENSFNN
jgi:hypothetical protein